MIRKEDIEVGMLVKRIYTDHNGTPSFKIDTIDRVNDKSFRLTGYYYTIKYDESHAYSVVTNDEYDLLYGNALNNACKARLTEVRAMKNTLSYLNDHIKELINFENEIGVEFTVNVDYILSKIGNVVDRLDKELGK